MKKLYSTAITAFFSVTAFAQLNMGVSTGNWSGTNSLYLNPANAAGSRHKWVIDAFTLIGSADNSLGSINDRGSVIGAINGGRADELFTYSDNKTFSLIAPYAEVRLPGIQYAFHPNHTVALTARVRGMNQFNNFDRSLYQTIADPDYTIDGDIDLTSQNFNYTGHIWSEVGLSYGGVIYDHGNGRLKGGATLRYLGGIGYIGLKGANLDAHFISGSDSFYAANSDLEYASNILSTQNALSNGFTNNSVISQFFGNKAGWGVGADLGLVYEFTPVDDILGTRGDYKFRLSASVIDIGSIEYEGDRSSNVIVTGNGYLTGQGLADNVRNFDDFRRYAVAQGFSADTTRRDTRVYMPTRLIAGADYRINRHYYVNATFIANLADRQRFGNSFYNQFVITPRYDSRIFSLGVPVSYNVLTENFRVGIGARFSGFFIGSDDMLALVASKQYGFNFYAGGFVPIAAHKMKDSDGDGVPDKADECPDVPGCRETGCPVEEVDNDRFDRRRDMDTTDNCPDFSYEAATDLQGAADADGDGLNDAEDACPSVAGPADNHGCPAEKAATKKTANFSVTTVRMQAGTTTISTADRATLNQLAKVMSEYPATTAIIEGYTDNRGSDAANKALAASRAAAVQQYLAAKGVSTSRLTVKALGSLSPLADNTTAEGRAANRRVVIRLNK